MSFTNDIRIMGMGSMGSEVATVIGRYQRLGEQKTSLSEDEENTLKKAINFVRRMNDGYNAVVEIRNFNINPEAPTSYNYYLRVRQELTEFEALSKDTEIQKEIKMFSDILTKLSQGKPLAEMGEEKLAKVAKFFAKLSDFALEELYMINNQKKQLESI